MVEFWKGEKEMEQTFLRIGEPMTLEAEQAAGVFAYKLAKLGYYVFTYSDECFAVVRVIGRYGQVNSMYFSKKGKRTIAEIDKLFDEFERKSS